MNAAVGWSWHALRVDPQTGSAEVARQLLRRIEFLTWPDRARVIDDFLWSEATSRLTSDEVTAVVNRHPDTARSTVDHYTSSCRAVISLTLDGLGEAPGSGGLDAMLTRRMSLDPVARYEAIEWLERQDGRLVRQRMAGLPGYAFLTLALSPSDSSDSSDSFEARDAFHRAMLGDAGS